MKPILRPKSIRRLLFPLLLAGCAGGADAATISWSGSAATSAWATGTNWIGGAAPANDLTTDVAAFDQASYAAQPAMAASGTVSVGGLQIGDAGGTATGALTLGTGGQILALGAGGITMYSGAGAATISTKIALGAAQTWTNNSASVLTVSGLIANGASPFALTIGGTGTTVLTGANTFTGVTLTGGVLRAAASRNSLGTPGSSPLTLQGGELQLAIDATNGSDQLKFNDNTTVSGNVQITLDRFSPNAGNTYVFGTLMIDGHTLTTATGGNVTSGTAGITFGATTLAAGAGTSTLNLGTNTKMTLGALGDGGTPTTLAVTGGGTLTLATTAAGLTAGTALSVGTGSIVILQTNANALGDGVVDAGVAGELDVNISQSLRSLSGLGTVKTSGGATTVLTISSSGIDTFAGTLSGTGALVFSGAGKLVLSGADSHSGGTAVSSGLLSVTGSSTGTGAVSVTGTSSSSYGTLGGGNHATLSPTAPGGATLKTYAAGAGAISGAVTVGAFGHLAPGDDAVGTLALHSLTLSAGSALDFEFNGIANDFVSVTTSGGLTLNGGALSLFQEGTTDAFAQAGLYDLFSYLGALGGDVANLSVANAQAGFSYTFVNDAADKLVQLRVDAVPEPGTAALLLAGGALLAGAARRRGFGGVALFGLLGEPRGERGP